MQIFRPCWRDLRDFGRVTHANTKEEEKRKRQAGERKITELTS